MKQRLAALLQDMRSSVVAVAGDVMLDEYILGDADRISPEAPNPVLFERERRSVPGGAANVAVNVNALGARAFLVGAVGADPEGDSLRRGLAERGVATEGLVEVPGRPTTRKTRLIARGSQLMRVDRETHEPVGSVTAREIYRRIASSKADVVVISDYAKGVVGPDLVRELIAQGRKVIVDPKSSDFGRYANSFLVTPNLGELRAATGRPDLGPENLEVPARMLMDRFGIANLLVTLGPDGMALIERGKPVLRVLTRAREVYDVTGAGDTVIAAVACAVAAGAELEDACFVANIAAGVVVGKHETATTTPEEIMAYAFGQSSSDKIVDRAALPGVVDGLRKAGKRIVFTNGCFDLLHVGHITYLNEARGLGDVLIVGLNTDRSIRALKGESRPIIPEQERSHVLAALESVGYVVLFDEDTPLDLIGTIRPDVLVKGADYTRDTVVGADIVESYGGKVHLIRLVDNASTTDIIRRIRES